MYLDYKKGPGSEFDIHIGRFEQVFSSEQARFEGARNLVNPNYKRPARISNLFTSSVNPELPAPQMGHNLLLISWGSEQKEHLDRYRQVKDYLRLFSGRYAEDFLILEAYADD